jgi:hypothetical protein
MHALVAMVKSAKPAPVLQRRDATGHLTPQYAAELLSHRGELAAPNDDRAFGPSAIRRDALAEELGESFLRTATGGGEDNDDEALEEVSPEEMGGPFIVTTGAIEFAHDTDESNPPDATREPFPRTSAR